MGELLGDTPQTAQDAAWGEMGGDMGKLYATSNKWQIENFEATHGKGW